MRDSKLGKCVPGLPEILFHILCIAWLHDLQSETFVHLARRRIGLIIGLSDEYIYMWICSKGFDERQGFIFSLENSTIACGEVNTILFITVRHSSKHDLIYMYLRQRIPWLTPDAIPSLPH